MKTYEAILWNDERAQESIMETLRSHFEGSDRFTYTEGDIDVIAKDIIADLKIALPDNVTLKI